MDHQHMRERAVALRARFADLERARTGKEWTPEQLMLGMVGDVGDLAKLVQGKAGFRPRADLDEALTHELLDVLWSVIVLADAYGIDLEAEFDPWADALDTTLHDAIAAARRD